MIFDTMCTISYVQEIVGLLETFTDRGTDLTKERDALSEWPSLG